MSSTGLILVMFYHHWKSFLQDIKEKSSPGGWAGTGSMCWLLPGIAQTSWQVERWWCCTWRSWCSYSGERKQVEGFGFWDRWVRQCERSTLTAYWNFSLYSLSLARTLLSSSAQRDTTKGNESDRDDIPTEMSQNALKMPDLKKYIGQKCTFRTECIPQRLSLSVRAWERQRVHRVWALIDKSMISVSSSVFESTMPWPHRHAHPNDWLELIPSTD